MNRYCEAALYEIRVGRCLGPAIAALFPEFTLTGDGKTTVMHGVLPDSTALYGVLDRIRDLGLTLISVSSTMDMSGSTEGCQIANGIGIAQAEIDGGDLLKGGRTMTNYALNRSCLVTPDLLENLPEPVQRYLTFSGVVGKPWVETVRLKYVGKFRLGADKPWMTVHADQVYRTGSPAFQWKAHFQMMGVPFMYGQDTYKDGQGHIFGKLVGLFTVFDERGDKALQGTMVRYLNEMTWFPAAYLGDNITWKPVDRYAADVTLHDGGESVSARMYFDDEGRVLNFIAQRYGTIGGQYVLTNWATPMIEYGPLGGLRLPVEGAALWQLPEGDLSYIKVHLTEIVYNQPIWDF